MGMIFLTPTLHDETGNAWPKLWMMNSEWIFLPICFCMDDSGGFLKSRVTCIKARGIEDSRIQGSLPKGGTKKFKGFGTLDEAMVPFAIINESTNVIL